MSKHTTLEQLRKLAVRTKTGLDGLDTRIGTLENAGYQNAQQVQDAINAKVASVYKPGGSKTAAELVAALLVAANEDKVYDISTVLTITDDNKDLFAEGIQASYPIGANFVVVNTGTDQAPAFKFDALPGFVDLSGYGTKPAAAAAGHIAKFDNNRNVVDGDLAVTDLQQKLAANSFTEGNVRTTNAQGFAQDSGVAIDSLLVGEAATDNEVDAMIAEVFGDDDSDCMPPAQFAAGRVTVMFTSMPSRASSSIASISILDPSASILICARVERTGEPWVSRENKTGV